jgi:ribose 5-phosphate isomerase B
LNIKVGIASDHAGFELKRYILDQISMEGFFFEDLGPSTATRTDYPDHADQVARRVQNGQLKFGILICGSGQGMAIRANRYPDVRAALCFTPEMAILSRAHNDANILCLGARFVKLQEVAPIIKSFFLEKFEGGRHLDRVEKLSHPIKT